MHFYIRRETSGQHDLHLLLHLLLHGLKCRNVASPQLWNSLPAEMKKTCCLVTF